MTDPWAGRRAESETQYVAHPDRYAGEPSAFSHWTVSVLVRYPLHKELIELGAGVGRDARWFAHSGFRVRAVDFSATAVERGLEAHRLSPEPVHSRWTIVHGEAGHFLRLLPPESVDVVYSHLLFASFTVPEIQSAWSEIHRVLRRGGLHFYCVRDTTDPNSGKGALVGPHTYFGGPHSVAYRYFTVEDLQALRGEAFESVELIRPPQAHVLYAADARRDPSAASIEPPVQA
ncbi:MAG: class I SAM-dependent methyltransferase, partial [Thermoplasmata archaeon]|nr:class I SAM-dependent methyltransferase [Thermoplasmata archaeon]